MLSTAHDLAGHERGGLLLEGDVKSWRLDKTAGGKEGGGAGAGGESASAAVAVSPRFKVLPRSLIQPLHTPLPLPLAI